MNRIVLALLILASACDVAPKPINYRKVEVSAPGKKRLEFRYAVRLVCGTRLEWYDETTTWRYEVDLDTASWCLCGIRCYVCKTPPGPETLRIRLSSRDDVMLDTFAIDTQDTTEIHVSEGWIPPHGHPGSRASIRVPCE